MQEAAFAQTLDAIYDAAVSYDRWPLALERIGAMFDCSVVSLIERDLQRQQGRTVASGIDQDSQREFIEVWGTHNIFVERTKAWRPGAIEPDRQILPKADLLASDYYNCFMKPRDMHALLRVALHVEGTHQQFLSLVRPPVAGEYEAGDVARFRPLVRHLQRAARITRHLDESRVMLSAVSGVLEQNPAGVLLLDQSGQVVFANRAARALAAKGDGLSLRRDRLALPDSRDDALLQRLVAGATRHLSDTIDARGGVMRLPRQSGKPDLIAVVAPLAADLAAGDWGAGSGPMALVALSDPDAAVQPPSIMLRQLFGLSAAETRVALAVMQGDSPSQIAERLGVKLTTARWHLASVFRKTGTTRQAELVRLLLSLPTTLGRLPN